MYVWLLSEAAQRHARFATALTPKDAEEINGPVSRVTWFRFVPPTPAENSLAKIVPMIVTAPVDTLFTPKAVVPDPPVLFPVRFKTPLPVTFIPAVLVAEPPVAFPVTFKMPELRDTAEAPAPDPPLQFPVTFKVPVEVIFTATAELKAPPKQLPTMDAVFGLGKLKATQFVEAAPPKGFAVSVTPLAKLKVPPAVAPPVVSLRNSATVVLTLTVMVNEFAMRTSAFVNVGNKLLAAPVGVAAQTSTALISPAFRA
jgi:hypothetical protein